MKESGSVPWLPLVQKRGLTPFPFLSLPKKGTDPFFPALFFSPAAKKGTDPFFVFVLRPEVGVAVFGQEGFEFRQQALGEVGQQFLAFFVLGAEDLDRHARAACRAAVA